MTARALATKPSRTASIFFSTSGSETSIGSQVTSSPCSPSTSMTASESPRRTPSATRAIPPPKRWTRSSTTMPSPIVVPGGGSPAGTSSQVTSASRLRTRSPMRSWPLARPTMSPRTAPASTDVSCPGLPTRISRASGRMASRSRPMSESETIDVSSTITTSWGRRLPRACRKRLWLSGRQPRRR